MSETLEDSLRHITIIESLVNHERVREVFALRIRVLQPTRVGEFELTFLHSVFLISKVDAAKS